MTSPRDRKHIIVTTAPSTVPYSPHGKAIRKRPIPTPNRQTHGAALKAALGQAQQAAVGHRAAAVAEGLPLMTEGIYVQFESPPNVDLKVESLEERRGTDVRKHIEVVAFTEEVRKVDGEDERIQRATVFVPDGAVKKFLKKFESYEGTPPPGAPPPPVGTKKVQRHHEAFDRVASLRAATLKALWTDDPLRFPSDNQPAWWEVWLRHIDGNEVTRFRAFAESAGITVGDRALAFDDRTIVLAHGPQNAMASSVDVLDAVAELRAVRPVAVGIDRLNNFEQGEYAADLAQRIQRRAGLRPAVCVLDTGVNRGHPLLAGDLDATDMHTVDPAWGTHDHDKHGTAMAGLALLGDITPVLLGNDVVDALHCLESVKLLPPPTAQDNPPHLYGALTAEAVSRPEVQQPARKRVFSMAITSPGTTDSGRPTSWSAAVDAIAAGRSFDPAQSGLVYLDDQPSPRLLVVSAGNVRENHIASHLDLSDVSPVEDPAQAWNALTVGACTDFGRLVETHWPGGRALAPPGELSPWSRTSLTFEKKWPLKPDVVFEGSNLVLNAQGHVDTSPAPSLNVVTTYYRPQEKVFDLSSGTSAATAQVARLGARIAAAYPALWPETIRALIVHSARWTPRMLQSVPPLVRRDVRRLVRRYGFGVPSEERAVRSARDALTLVHESAIHPFVDGKLREMHVHELPWPREALSALGATNVILRVTLSYFIEPNPSRRGHTSRYRYASHGLRFDLKKATETTPEFRKRINGKDLGEEEEKPDTSGDISEWRIGNIRNLGSLHSDLWLGSAADLAERGVLAVYPVSGWWKDLPKRDRSQHGARYALIVSIETDEVDVEVDLWTAVAQQIGIQT